LVWLHPEQQFLDVQHSNYSGSCSFLFQHPKVP
jgi:hypothetical protein